MYTIESIFCNVIYTSDTATNAKEAVLEALAKGYSLAGANLCGQDLSNINLTGVDFEDADLSNVNFQNTNLTNTNFHKAYL
jgi:uncharacterized protein YjbI with pentapeptide repeats